jgi:hypothetical protein
VKLAASFPGDYSCDRFGVEGCSEPVTGGAAENGRDIVKVEPTPMALETPI